MKYYVVNSVLQGIQYKTLKTGVDFKGTVLYFINLESTDNLDQYYNPENVFSDYRQALQYFCNECDKAVKQHQAQINAINHIKNCELSLC